MGNQAFSALARQGAGILPDGRAHPDVESAIAQTRGGGQKLDDGSREKIGGGARRLAPRRPRAHRRPRELACAVGLGPRLHDRQRRLLREGRVQPRLERRPAAARARADARRPAARRVDAAARSRSRSRATHSRTRRRRRPVTSSADPPTAPCYTFDALDARIRSAVEAVAATDPNPADPFRGLYISDELAVELVARGPGQDLDDRIALAARLLGLSDVEAAAMALCAAPELGPHYGRLFAYLHDDVTRKLASPRLVARLLADSGISAAQALDCFDHAAPLRRTGAVRLLEAGSQLPVADRLLKISDRLAAHLLASGLDEPARDGRLRPVPRPRVRPGPRRRRSPSSARCSPPTAALPDPRRRPRRRGAARGRARPAAPPRRRDRRRRRRADARRRPSRALLEGRQHLLRRPRRSRARQAPPRAAGLRRPRRADARSAPPRRRRSSTLGEATAIVVEAPQPSFARAPLGLDAARPGSDEIDDVAAKFRLSIGQINDAAARREALRRHPRRGRPAALRPRPRRPPRVEHPPRRARHAARRRRSAGATS